MGRPKTTRQATRLTITLNAEDYAKICNLANQNDVSAAWIIRRAIDSYLERPQAEAAPAKPAVKRGGGRS
jgi:predicted transcriptional regulator